MEEILGRYFEGVDDPRSSRNQKHPLLMLMGTTLLAGLSGIDSFSGIADFVEAHLEALGEFFDFPKGPPSHDTYQRLWDAINPEAFYGSFELFTQSLSHIAPDVTPIDGKTIRNSGTGKALHIVSAWCEANQLVLAQEKVDSKSNELTAIPKLLSLLSLTGRVVTLDAMGAQRHICEQIIAQEGDYLIALKGNQGRLFEDIKRYLGDEDIQKELSTATDHDKGHGRLETRTSYVSEDISWLQKHHQWPGLRTVAMVRSTVQRGAKRTEETRFYITSLPADARRINEVARMHWGIENKLHWRLDVTFNEDKAGIRNDNAAENMDIVRKWALNVLSKSKKKPDQSIKGLMRKNAMSFPHLKRTVKEILHA